MKVMGSTIQQLDKGPDGRKPRAKCRKWRLWATTEAGRRSSRFEGTWTQAQDALRAWVSDLEGAIPDGESFASYAESWRLWRDKSGNFAPGTIQGDARAVRSLLRSPIAQMRLDSIGPQECRDALLWIKSHPQRRGGELTNTTMGKMHTVLHSILQQAEDDGRIARNPMARIKPPKPDTKEKEALSPEELHLFLNRVDGLPLDGRSMALYLMAMLGLRRGEACALLDSDVSGGYANVHLAVKERDGSVGEPKSAAGIRKLPVPPRLQAKIGEWRDLRRALGFASSPTLACNTEGGILRPQLLQRWWSGDARHAGAAARIGCSGITMHQLRHSNLSMMARHMSPFDLQRWAGWSSIEPAKVYIHDDLESVSRAVAEAWG